jgi:hypothetical protein
MSERTEELQGKIENENDPDDIMMYIMEVFSETEIIPDEGNYYTFVYNAEIVGRLHVIQNDEIEYMRSLSYANFKTK